MPRKSVKNAGRIQQITNKTVWKRADFYAEIWGVGGALSAGIIALDLLDSEGREKAIKIAKGLAEVDGKVDKTGTARPAVVDAVDIVKYATVQYKLLSKEDKEALDELRRILSPPPPPPRKRKTKTG